MQVQVLVYVQVQVYVPVQVQVLVCVQVRVQLQFQIYVNKWKGSVTAPLHNGFARRSCGVFRAFELSFVLCYILQHTTDPPYYHRYGTKSAGEISGSVNRSIR